MGLIKVLGIHLSKKVFLSKVPFTHSFSAKQLLWQTKLGKNRFSQKKTTTQYHFKCLSVLLAERPILSTFIDLISRWHFKCFYLSNKKNFPKVVFKSSVYFRSPTLLHFSNFLICIVNVWHIDNNNSISIILFLLSCYLFNTSGGVCATKLLYPSVQGNSE